MMNLRNLSSPLALSLLLLAACGGGSSSHSSGLVPATAASTAASATGLAYTDPTGTGWRLVQDASSTDSRLVLNLVGPTGTLTRGVGFNLQGPNGITFGTFANGLTIQDLGVYELLTVSGNEGSEPVAMVGGVKPGNLLSVGIFQKSRARSAKDSGQPLCQIALTLDATAGLHAGDALAISVVKAGAIPEDIGTTSSSYATILKKCNLMPLTIEVGSLSAK